MFQNNPSAAKPTDAPAANVGAQPVEANPPAAESVKEQARTYSPEDVEKIVKDRLARERKKFEKMHNQPVADASESSDDPAPKAPVSPNVAEDFKAKLNEERRQRRELEAKLGKYREETVKAQIERKLNEHNCLDPEVVLDHFTSRKLVHMDDEGELVVENATGDLDDLVRDYLAKKPHLVKANAVGGLGTKAPAPAMTEKPTSLAELEKALGIQRTDKKRLFDR